MNTENQGYKKVLAAIDLSKCSPLIIKKAQHIANQHEASLDVIHVVSIVMPSFAYSAPSDILDTIYAEAKPHFLDFCKQYHILEKHRHLFIGSAKQHILQLLHSGHFDLLVLGSHGDHHVFPGRFGSTSNSMLGKVKCDVLTVSVEPSDLLEEDALQKEAYAY